MRRARIFKRQQKESAQGLVEFAISLTFILILLAGLVDLGQAFFSLVALRDAAQEGAVYASVYPIIDTNGNNRYDDGEPLNTAAIIARVRNSSTTPVDLTDTANVSVNVSFGRLPCAGGVVTVEVTYNYRVSTPLVGSFVRDNAIPLTASASNIILWPACR